MKEKILEFFVVQSDHRPDDNENLFESGVLDSFGVVEFLSFIQEELGVEVPIEDITEENFSTVNQICRLIEEQGI